MKILDVPQSGSVAGVTSSRNRFGQYKRTRAVPVNPNTDRQSLVRSRLASLSTSWGDLTELQRTNWNALAASMGVTDSLGSVVFPTGFNRYVGTNLARLNLGLTTLPDAPAATIAAPAPVFSLLAAEGGAELQWTGATAGERFVANVAPYGRPGREFFSDFRFIAADVAAAGAGSLSLNSPLEEKFGTYVAGQVLAVRVDRLDNDGMLISQTVIRGTVTP